MNVMILQVFVSLMLVAFAVTLFIYMVRSRTLDHSERLSLAPLEDDVRPEPLSHEVPRNSRLSGEM